MGKTTSSQMHVPRLPVPACPLRTMPTTRTQSTLPPAPQPPLRPPRAGPSLCGRHVAGLEAALQLCPTALRSTPVLPSAARPCQTPTRPAIPPPAATTSSRSTPPPYGGDLRVANDRRAIPDRQYDVQRRCARHCFASRRVVSDGGPAPLRRRFLQLTACRLCPLLPLCFALCSVRLPQRVTHPLRHSFLPALHRAAAIRRLCHRCRDACHEDPHVDLALLPVESLSKSRCIRFIRYRPPPPRCARRGPGGDRSQ